MMGLLIFIGLVWLSWSILKGGFWLAGSIIKIVFKICILAIVLMVCFYLAIPLLIIGLVIAGIIGIHNKRAV